MSDQINNQKTSGIIGVTSQNIFPIIKKFLYSDHEIFLRELVANAVDATQKLKVLATSGTISEEIGQTQVVIRSDTQNGTITILDRGIGMTQEEVEKYINQIAFSSAGEFLDKYKDQINNIIGHFGLGFYSSFMVASKVEIVTKSHHKEAPAVKWSCQGDPEYTIEPADKEDRGTEVILYLDDDSKSFAEPAKIKELLLKYCRFLPVEILFDDKTINETQPLWARKPVDLKEEDYLNFYRELYPMLEDPLFYIHLNVDYPFTLTGILYFPKIKDKLDISRNKIQLYCNQVFVTDSVENIVPDFLTLLHGVIDSPDIPLNVSRSYLQSDSNVKKISSHITKKVSDRLEDLYKNERKSLEEKWDNLKLFIEYGMLSDEKFFERAEKFYLLKDTDNGYYSFEEYKKAIETEQTDKDKHLIYIYASNVQEQYSAIESAKNLGYSVLILDSPLTAHFVNQLETKWKETRFIRVDSDVASKLIVKEELEKPSISETEQQELRLAFEAVVPKEGHFYVTFENLRVDDQPVLIIRSEFMRRYREMSAVGGGMNFYGSMPESFSLVVNCNHPLIQQVIKQKREKCLDQLSSIANERIAPQSALDQFHKEIDKKKADEISPEQKEQEQHLQEKISELDNRRRKVMEEFAEVCPLIGQTTDLALLSNNLLQGEALSKFVKRSVSLL
ncbi:MAG: molecular chaperone HtpG [Prevotellaceae bacterium]|jgi:molecular chaperone HtpG|nr:molecular chaperone HtpG [Prevotellaceae bacterium]